MSGVGRRTVAYTTWGCCLFVPASVSLPKRREYHLEKTIVQQYSLTRAKFQFFGGERNVSFVFTLVSHEKFCSCSHRKRALVRAQPNPRIHSDRVDVKRLQLFRSPTTMWPRCFTPIPSASSITLSKIPTSIQNSFQHGFHPKSKIMVGCAKR